jgi:activator of 2-hydroxyglutaryl-CoA dehydratase
MHLNTNTSKADLASGINQAMAARVAILAKSVGVEKDVCMTGGVAKNAGVVGAMEK